MVFEHRSEGHFYRIPKAPGNDNVQFADIFTSGSNVADGDKLTASVFSIRKSDDAGPPIPKYENEETGIVIRGTLNVQDETGKKVTLGPGGVFFVHRGSTMTFTTDDFAIAYKVANRPKIFENTF